MERFPVLGTRGSPLALAQARMAAAALENVRGWPAGSVIIRPVKTSGDRIQDRPLADVGGKALWTKELDLALAAGDIDFSVHSMKDVESERPEAFALAAMLPRADVRDRLVGAARIADLAQGARVGTSSPRRTAQLLRRRPDLSIVILRGNVQTRLDKVAGGETDATLLAAAGLDRLGLAVGQPIAVEELLPAPGQAAIGIECRAEDRAMRELLAAIDDPATSGAVTLERAFTRRLGGTCHSPVAALARQTAQGWVLDAELLSEDGSEHVTERRIVAGEAEAEAMASAMLGRAGPAIRRLFEMA